MDLDPTPRLPRLFSGEGGGVGADRGRGGTVGVGVGGGLLPGRTLPKLTGTWAGPLLWPNEVNQVKREMRSGIWLDSLLGGRGFAASGL